MIANAPDVLPVIEILVSKVPVAFFILKILSEVSIDSTVPVTVVEELSTPVTVSSTEKVPEIPLNNKFCVKLNDGGVGDESYSAPKSVILTDITLPI